MKVMFIAERNNVNLSGSHVWNKTEIKHCRRCLREITRYLSTKYRWSLINQLRPVFYEFIILVLIRINYYSAISCSHSSCLVRRFLVMWFMIFYCPCWNLSTKHTVFHKREPFIFDYNSRIPWSLYIILSPVKTGMNTLQSHVIYLLNCLITS